MVRSPLLILPPSSKEHLRTCTYREPKETHYLFKGYHKLSFPTLSPQWQSHVNFEPVKLGEEMKPKKGRSSVPLSNFPEIIQGGGWDSRWDLEPSTMFLLTMDDWTLARSSQCKVGFLLHLFQMQLCNWPADWPEPSCVIMKAGCTVFQLLPIQQNFQLQKEQW